MFRCSFIFGVEKSSVWSRRNWVGSCCGLFYRIQRSYVTFNILVWIFTCCYISYTLYNILCRWL